MSFAALEEEKLRKAKLRIHQVIIRHFPACRRFRDLCLEFNDVGPAGCRSEDWKTFGRSGAEDGSVCMHPQSSPARKGSEHIGGIEIRTREPVEKVIRAELGERAGGQVTGKKADEEEDESR